jgi:hypothetical protein
LSSFLDSSPSTSSGPITHLFAAHTAVAKNVFPRLAGTMNVSHVADILSVKHDDASKTTEYTRPIYAGNAILQIKTSQDKDRIGIVSVRTTAFEKAKMGGSGAEVEEVAAQAESSKSSLDKTATASINSRPLISLATSRSYQIRLRGTHDILEARPVICLSCRFRWSSAQVRRAVHSSDGAIG